MPWCGPVRAGGTAPAIIAPFAAFAVASPTAITQASAVNDQRPRTRVIAAKRAASVVSAAICIPFGPRRSTR